MFPRLRAGTGPELQELGQMQKLLTLGLLTLWLTGCSASPGPSATPLVSSPSASPSAGPKLPETAEAASKEIAGMLEGNSMAKAKASATAALTRWPNNGKLLAQRGDAEQALGEVKEAEADFTAALKNSPKEAQWRLLESRAIARMGLSKYDEAEKDFAAAAKTGGDKAPKDQKAILLQLRGRNLLEAGKYKEAIPYFNQALKLNPEDQEGLGMRALCYYRMGDNKKYQAELEKLQKVNPATVQAVEYQARQKPMTASERQMAEGIQLLQSTQYELALSRFDRALELDPKNAEAWRRKGTALQKLGQYEKAAEAFTKCWDMSQNEAALFGRANCYRHMEQKDKARADFELYLKVGTNEKAMDIAREALRGMK